MTLTIISHIYNEEYLLPFWLQHHRDLFDHGIIIDYYSSDRSLSIIKEFCPKWKIIKTRNIDENGRPNFQAHLIDNEVMEIEMEIQGFKICLNTTEFLMYNQSKEGFENMLEEKKIYDINVYSPVSTHVVFYPSDMIEFYQNMSYIYDSGRGKRFLHSETFLPYSVGRHSHNLHVVNEQLQNTVILWCGFYPQNVHIYRRKLQIQNNIPEYDRIHRFGFQHIINGEELYTLFQQFIQDGIHRDIKKSYPIFDELLKFYSNKYK